MSSQEVYKLPERLQKEEGLWAQVQHCEALIICVVCTQALELGPQLRQGQVRPLESMSSGDTQAMKQWWNGASCLMRAEVAQLTCRVRQVIKSYGPKPDSTGLSH